jgi:hypothetical protein
MTKYSFMYTGSEADWKVRELSYSLIDPVPILNTRGISPRYLRSQLDRERKTIVFEYKDGLSRSLIVLQLPRTANIATLRHILCTHTGKLQVYIDDIKKQECEDNKRVIRDAARRGDVVALREAIAAQRVLLEVPDPGHLQLLLAATDLPELACENILRQIPRMNWSYGTFEDALVHAVGDDHDDHDEALEILLAQCDLDKRAILEMINSGFYGVSLHNKSKPENWVLLDVHDVYIHYRIIQFFKLTQEEIKNALIGRRWPPRYLRI